MQQRIAAGRGKSYAMKVKVREIMRQALVTIRPDVPARAAAELMRAREV